MAATYLGEHQDGRSYKRNWRGDREYITVHKVKTSANTDTALTVVAAVPYSYGDGFSGDSGAILVDVSARQSSEYMWYVTTTFSSRLDFGNANGGSSSGSSSGDPGEYPDNPLSAPIKYKLDTVIVNRSIIKDLDGKPLINSAGQLFADPFTVEHGLIRLTATANVSGSLMTPSAIKGYGSIVGCINDSTHLGFDAYDLRLLDFSSHNEYKPDYGGYWEVTQSYLISDDDSVGWSLIYILDQGWSYLRDGELFPILDKQGFQITSQALLNGSGEPLAAGANAAFKTFEVYPTADFDNLPIN